MTRRVSIITAAYAPKADYLDEAMSSVLAQEMPHRWEYEWLVQEDGTEPQLADKFADIPNVHYAANHAQAGAAVGRNFALARATGELVQVLDHDDVLLPHALRTLIPHFDNPQVGWACGQADDLLPDGTRTSYESAMPFGTIDAGAVNSWAIDHDANWPVHCAALMLRTDLVRAAGGWAASPIDEDIIMFSALSELSAGYNDETITWLYRIHDQQTHKTDTSRLHSQTGRTIALQRIQALSRVGLNVNGQPTPVRNFEAQAGDAAKYNVAPGTTWWK
ncbi:glycosyltransferase [Prauserella rugosa]|uniref:Glycosyl transferase family 2 n=1 Tax=Prauserella rugosa TaxID=43354 RepID=A0A660CDR7_9PSEU|nr:glycosyltransferase family 2 protein [Prauserella rugosa]TWH21542.1 glycosyl transferase family 2 [Prauserella rugosa]